jgi:AraC-like DNA-binding protein
MEEAERKMDGMTAPPTLAFAGLGLRPVTAVPWHSHGAPILIRYTHGRGRLTWGGGVIPFARGTVICVPASLPYAEDSAAGFISLYIAVAGLRLERIEAFQIGEDRRFALASELLLEEYRRGDAAGCADALVSLLRALRRQLHAAPRDALVDAALELIHAHAGDPAFSIPAAARRLGVPIRRLRARFARAVGASPLRYLTLRRIEEAKRLLEDGGFPVEAVAARVGFSDPYYFSRAFRRSVGASPRQWRTSRPR